MQRIKIDQPEKFGFTTNIPIRITDLNYGNHVGNDAFLAIIHEARLQYLLSLGYTELDVAGKALIMADAAIEFKAEMHYGDVVEIAVAAAGFTATGFDLVYKMIVTRQGQPQLAGVAKTGMLCFDYTSKKIVSLPMEALVAMQA